MKKKKNKLLFSLLSFTLFFTFLGIVLADNTSETLTVRNKGASGATYDCDGDTVNIYNIGFNGDSGVNFYTPKCSVPFKGADDTNDYTYKMSTDKNNPSTAYVTCLDVKNKEAKEIQAEIWDNLSSYPKINVYFDEGFVTSNQELSDAQMKLIEDGKCPSSTEFFYLVEYENEEDSTDKLLNVAYSKHCNPIIKVVKECNNFDDGTFTIHVAGETQEIKCGETKTFYLNDTLQATLSEEVTDDMFVNISYIDASGKQSKNESSTLLTLAYGTTYTVKVKNSLGSVILTKTDGTTNNPLSNVKFRLEVKTSSGTYKQATYLNGDLIPDKTTDDNGVIKYDSLPLGNYRLVEVSNSTGSLVLSNSKEFTISSTNLNEKIPFVNNPTYLNLYKEDMDGNRLDGSIFVIEIKDEKTNTFKTIGEIAVGKLGTKFAIEEGVYRFYETQSPTGYSLIEPFTIKVSSDKKIEILNDPSKLVILSTDGASLIIKNERGKIAINKLDSATKEFIEGAVFRLIKADKTKVAEFTTSKSSYRIALDPGKYILEEVSAPKKYEKLKNNLVFTVLEDGSIVSDNQDVSFDINGLTINVYNTVPVVVPDTLSVTYLTIIIGILLIGVGGFVLYKKGYEKI